MPSRVADALGGIYDALDKTAKLKFKGGGLEELLRYQFAVYGQAIKDSACNQVPSMGSSTAKRVIQACMRPAIIMGEKLATLSASVFLRLAPRVVNAYLLKFLMGLTRFTGIVNEKEVALFVEKHANALHAILQGKKSSITLRDVVTDLAYLPGPGKLQQWINKMNMPFVLTGGPGNAQKAKAGVKAGFGAATSAAAGAVKGLFAWPTSKKPSFSQKKPSFSRQSSLHTQRSTASQRSTAGSSTALQNWISSNNHFTSPARRR
jgi:hypothetical protein